MEEEIYDEVDSAPKVSVMDEEISQSVEYQNVPLKKEKEDRAVISEVNPKELATLLSKVEAAARCHSRLLLVCLGILCVFLAANIVVMVVYITMGMNKQEANLSAENQQLMDVLKNRTEHLNRQKDDLNWTLGVILTFDSFPVNQFCPDKKCQPCRGGWILYQKKCYLFYEPAPWKTWTQSQTYCKDSGADLVVIDNQQEQEFISNNTKYSYSVDHGYWIGLKESNGTFIWIDGRTDTLGYWLETGGSDSYVLVIPDKSPTKSWKRSSPEFQLRFICESEALIRLN
ncbi:C-type lectin domain family 7 member A-like [Odontesthes bonariensis]|uniref:C-type lectin domain family 7 member A-like n=1 Tax=Odontesthes bonariensis TaxID=219752 RepID=UPI003F58D3E9